MSEQKKTTKVESTLDIKATASLDAEILKELEIPDVTVEQAQALLETIADDEKE